MYVSVVQNMFDALKRDHHLKHTGRQQLGNFLKVRTKPQPQLALPHCFAWCFSPCCFVCRQKLKLNKQPLPDLLICLEDHMVYTSIPLRL